MTNCGRNFQLSNKQAKTLDYDLLDRVIHSVPIDTTRHQSLYHHLVFKQIPLNLRPSQYFVYAPEWTNKNFNSSRFIWKILNRTIYRP